MKTQDVAQTPTPEITVEMRDAFMAATKTQLDKFQAHLNALHNLSMHVPENTKLTYQHRLQDLSARLGLVQEKAQALSLTGPDGWDTLRADLETHLALLKNDFREMQGFIQHVRVESIGWAEGFTEDDTLESIGWAEGFTEKDPVKSIGWAEGFTEEDPVESIGWAEGFED